ncbi:PREDICTED: INO80 complex subunit C [Poecilia mexicana]|uniref:INO80 complex subunit C n=1 Tax=Poecilia mexicana TaxID=48701 RepID=UPI00072DE86D|nr:PREDICTED: INO80 complex subunit C [Poecilia mexicana]
MASQIPITVKAQPPTTSAAAVRGKKRPGSPAVSGVQQAAVNSSISGSKKKKPPLTVTPATQTQITAVETVVEMKTVGSVDSTPTTTETVVKAPPFKDNTFMHSGLGGAAAGKKNRTWKNLKQILALERTLPWKLSDPNYYNIDAPPSLKPAKKYSDISGLPANYTDPQTKLRFTSSEEFSYIRLLPTDVVTGYLTLRKATCIVP